LEAYLGHFFLKFSAGLLLLLLKQNKTKSRVIFERSVQNSIAKFFVLFHVEKLSTGESLQVLCVLGTGEGLTGCHGGFKTLRYFETAIIFQA